VGSARHAVPEAALLEALLAAVVAGTLRVRVRSGVIARATGRGCHIGVAARLEELHHALLECHTRVGTLGSNQAVVLGAVTGLHLGCKLLSASALVGRLRAEGNVQACLGEDSGQESRRTFRFVCLAELLVRRPPLLVGTLHGRVELLAHEALWGHERSRLH